MNLLDGKKILLVTFQFYNYPNRIKEELNKLGADVTYLNPFADQSLIKEHHKRKYIHLDKEFVSSVKKIGKAFDYLFLINLNIFSTETINWLVDYFQNSKKIVYLWDSLDNSVFDTGCLKLFDRVYSFDPIDCKKNSYIQFLPLFYCDSDKIKKEYKYDFMFIGVARQDRYDYIKKIKDYAIANNLTYYFKLYFRSPLIYYYNKIIKGLYKNTKASDFTYTLTSQEQLKQIMSDSRIIVDMEINKQNGLTMRTIECLGMQRKLITTNKDVVNYDFYNPNNILCVDRDTVQIKDSFIKKDYSEINKEIYKKYSLEYWIKVIFNI